MLLLEELSFAKFIQMGYLIIFIEIAIRNRSQQVKSKAASSIQPADRPEIEFTVAYDVIESVNFAEFN